MEYEIKPKEKFSLGLAELWQYRELFYFFTWRDIKVKYKQTTLGFAWAILQPLLMMIIFTAVFGKTFKDPELIGVPYEVFAFSGLILWNIFSSGLTSAGNSMVSNANIIKKIYFPRLIIPVSAVLVSLFDFLMAFAVFIGLLIYYHIDINISRAIIFLPLSLLITTVATFGIGSLLAALNIKYRDFRYIIPFMVQALLFITPVIYPISIISNPVLKYVVAANPMYSAIALFRSALFDKPLQLDLILISITSAVLSFVIGIYYFRRTEAYFADLA
ncbi:MAG: ABC transporter permease [Bacteroidetes bacterium]|nr:ABC transporter permease [Bacteroidota bacterium]